MSRCIQVSKWHEISFLAIFQNENYGFKQHGYGLDYFLISSFTPSPLYIPHSCKHLILTQISYQKNSYILPHTRTRCLRKSIPNSKNFIVQNYFWRYLQSKLVNHAFILRYLGEFPTPHIHTLLLVRKKCKESNFTFFLHVILICIQNQRTRV